MNTGTKLPSTNPKPDFFVNHVTTNVTSAEVQGIQLWPQAKQYKHHFIPLVFVTNWNSSYNCQIGFRDVEQNLKPNLEWALTQKFNQSDLFKHRIALDSLDYTLEVSVDTVNSHIPFVSKGTCIFAVVAYTYWFREGVEESALSIHTSYKFTQGSEILKQGTVKTARHLPAEGNNTGSKKKYMQRYFTNYFGILNNMLNDNATEIVKQLETDLLSRQ